MIIDAQVSPAVVSWAGIEEAALAAEAAGFGAFFVFDHLAGTALDGQTMLEAFSLLGALSQVTTTIPLGTMVANVWNRQIGTLVAAAASVAVLADRQIIFGIGAGASPTSPWATEHHAVGTPLEPALSVRHDRVQQVIDLAREQWRDDRDERYATFPLPTPPPIILVGVNSIELSRLAGRSADGINVTWRHPRCLEFLAAADQEAAGRPFLRTAYAPYDPALLDLDHPKRREIDDARLDRLVLVGLESAPKFPDSV